MIARVLCAAAVATFLAGCGGDDESLDESKIERCATALVPYAKEGDAGKGMAAAQDQACGDLNANEKSEAIARMYRKQSEQAP
ncbi:MAG: hypothetical protein ACT4QF_01175 [Sporichthyaceae bacterium]